MSAGAEALENVFFSPVRMELSEPPSSVWPSMNGRPKPIWPSEGSTGT